MSHACHIQLAYICTTFYKCKYGIKKLKNTEIGFALSQRLDFNSAAFQVCDVGHLLTIVSHIFRISKMGKTLERRKQEWALHVSTSKRALPKTL